MLELSLAFAFVVALVNPPRLRSIKNLKYPNLASDVATRTMISDEFDEFGDPSFLGDVDLDAITGDAWGAGAPPVLVSPPAENRANSRNESKNLNPTKRRKISPSPGNSDSDIERTLSTYFGYSKFREGQLSAIQSVITGKEDVAVFWATGSGKSICYQIPALHTKKITLVVSPLISLMKDQVHKLNGLMAGEDLATFLGSGQTDATQERAALQGHYLLVYVTPEKFLSDGFLGKLATLHATRREIGLFAIDEAHCISEWGHDFRPEFRQLGQVLRTQASRELQDLPIMALTATAVPKVQNDISKSLLLRSPLVVRKSFDRTNLVIAVHRKDRSSALKSAMEPLVKILSETASPLQQSTIVYAPTRSQVEEIAAFLKQRLERANGEERSRVRVDCYHAGMTLAARNDAHTNFLTGRTTVICATVAFGMGIDKPDTRRVIHFGPPKTVEEYYQQIGRAGRDGIQAECTMYVAEGDFDKYKNDFYLGGLQGRTKEAVLASIGALKAFALDASTCRRKTLLEFFDETPLFGERCGTCDNCKRHATYSDSDLERDFGPIARVLLQAADALNEQGAGTIIDVIAEKTVDSYRYKRGTVASQVKEQIISRKKDVTKKVSQEVYREFLVPLVQRGFMQEATKTTQVNGYSRSWTTYSLTPDGRRALSDSSLPIVLPVPESILEAERKEKARRERVLSQLKENGVQIEKLPQEELEAGDGDVIRAYSKWQAYLESMRRNGKEERVAMLEELLFALETWRAETAIAQQMAPASVLPEHTLLTLSYAAATMPAGLTIGEDDLIAAGVRSRGIQSLCKALAAWAEKYRPAQKDIVAGGGANERVLMKLTPGEVVKGRQPWKHAVYKVVKKTGLASWESSYNRFRDGESPQTIAMKPDNGRPIQMKTVCGHIMQAVVQGRGVDLHRLASFLPPPTASEWEQLQAAEISQGLDVVEDDKIKKADLLRPILGDKFVDTPYDERDEEAKSKFYMWCDRLDWYMALRRIGWEPSFSADQKALRRSCDV